MSSKFYYLFFALIILITFLACSRDDGTPLGFTQLENRANLPQLLTINSDSTDRTYYDIMLNGSSPYLLLGNGYPPVLRTRILLLFDLPDTITSIEKANLILYPTYQDSITFTSEHTDLSVDIHQITSKWEEGSVIWSDDWDNAGSNYFANIDSSFTFTPSNTDTGDIYLPLTSLLQQIIAADYDSVNLLFIPNESASVLRSFYSKEITNGPRLEIVSNGDTLTLLANKDAFIIHREEANITTSETQINIGTASPSRGLFHFDVTSIPAYSTINRAQFTLHIADTTYWYSSGGSLQANNAYNSDNPLEWWITGTIVDTGYSYGGWIGSLSKQDNTFEGEFRTIVQEWINEPDKNYGIMLRSATENLDLMTIGLYSADADSLCPELKIWYTLPPGTWF